MILDDLPSMALFARVAQLRSFSAAAREAGIAKSAVSKRIAALERRLGVLLLTRTTRALSLTEEGLRYYDHCRALVAAADAAESSVAGSKDRPAGRVRINAPVTFAQMYLARSLARFLVQHPALEVDLSTDNRSVDLVESGLDLVIRVSRLRASALVARRLAPVRLLVCAAPSYLARAGNPRTPEELSSHDCLRYSLLPAEVEWRFGTAERPLGIPVRGSLATNDGTVLREAAVAGLGLVVLPEFMVARELADGRLLAVLQDHPLPDMGLYALHADRRLVPARVRVLLDFLADHFAHAAWAALAES